jgi:hypothetical protein
VVNIIGMASQAYTTLQRFHSIVCRKNRGKTIKCHLALAISILFSTASLQLQSINEIGNSDKKNLFTLLFWIKEVLSRLPAASFQFHLAMDPLPLADTAHRMGRGV